jgi:guanylate kinase
MPSSPERLLVIIGPSGAGKSTAVRRLEAEGLIEVTPTWTTRPPRRGEILACVEHRFVSEGEFERLERCGAFLGTVRLFGLPFRYGLPPIHRPAGGRVAAIMLRAALVPRLRELFADLTVYQVEDDRARVAERLQQRGREGAELGSRLADFEAEVALGRSMAQRVVVNADGPDMLVAALREALRLDFAAELGTPVSHAPGWGKGRPQRAAGSTPVPAPALSLVTLS